MADKHTYAATPTSTAASTSPQPNFNSDDSEPEDDLPPPAYDTIFPPRQLNARARSRSQPSASTSFDNAQPTPSAYQTRAPPQPFDARQQQYAQPPSSAAGNSYDAYDNSARFERRRGRRQGPLHMLAGLAMNAIEERQAGTRQQRQPQSMQPAPAAAYGRRGPQVGYQASAQDTAYGRRAAPAAYGEQVPDGTNPRGTRRAGQVMGPGRLGRRDDPEGNSFGGRRRMIHQGGEGLLRGRRRGW